MSSCNNKHRLLGSLAGLLLLICSCSSYDIMRGEVYMIGNEPFTELALETDNNEIYTISERSPVYDKLLEHQTELIEVSYEMINGEIYVTGFKIKRE